MKKSPVWPMSSKMQRRTVSGFLWKNPGAVFLLLLLLPYLITLFLGNLKQEESVGERVSDRLGEGEIFLVNETLFGKETIPLEYYVADRLTRTLSAEFEAETLKAQAVLIRTNLLFSAEWEALDAGQIVIRDEGYGQQEPTEACLMAAAQTRGIYLEYEGKPAYGAYFYVSSGHTREGAEVLSGEDYSYLHSVSCDRDFLSEKYAQTVSVRRADWDAFWAKQKNKSEQESENMSESESLQETAAKLTSLSENKIVYDSAGYVLALGWQGKQASGEALQEAFRLPSADFELQLQEDTVLFRVRGTGHGLGMSQFGANEMAKQGSTYLEILEYFFSELTMTKLADSPVDFQSSE